MLLFMMLYLCHRFGHNPNRASPAYGNAKIAISTQSSAHYCTFHSHRRDHKKPKGSGKPEGSGKSDSSDRADMSESSYSSYIVSIRNKPTGLG